MIVPNVNRTPLLIPVRAPKSSLLLVCDSAERLRTLQAGINKADFEIKIAGSTDELRRICREEHDHDIVVLDVGSSLVVPMLKMIRLSNLHTEVPVLVESTRVMDDFNLAGVLPFYRAMPCNHAEIFKLLRHYREAGNRREDRRRML